MTDTDRHKRQIEAQLQELGARLKRVEDSLDEPADQDLSDQAIELEDDEVLEGIGRATLREVRLLEGHSIALQKGHMEFATAAARRLLPHVLMSYHMPFSAEIAPERGHRSHS